jgi:DNA-binding CsgD family transcriptional regulator
MDKEEILKQAIALYKSGSKHRKIREFDGEISLSEYLVSSFHIGDYFFFVYYFPEQEMEFCSDGIRRVLNIEPAEFTLPFIVENMHPDDLKNFMRFENTLLTFLPTISPERLLNYKSCYDYRLKAREGDYKRILHQVRTLQIEPDGATIRTFGVFTDITHLKDDTHMQLDLIGLNGEASYYDIQPDGTFTPGESPLTPRETEILKLLAEGLSSDEISRKLDISKNTVNNHRSKILEKTATQNAMEAVKKALRGHWI